MSPPPRGGDMPLGGKKDAAKKCVCAAGCGSVFAGQQQRGEAAIPFGDDPKLQVARDLVGREQTILTGLQRGVVLPDRKSTRLNSVTNAPLVCRILLEKHKEHK